MTAAVIVSTKQKPQLVFRKLAGAFVAKFCVVFYSLPPACLCFVERMRLAFEAALHDAFTVTGKAVIATADNGGSTGQVRAERIAGTANKPAANKPLSLDAKAATLIECGLCGCDFISPVSFLNSAILLMREALSPQPSDLESW
jgi:hypothetical protein